MMFCACFRFVCLIFLEKYLFTLIEYAVQNIQAKDEKRTKQFARFVYVLVERVLAGAFTKWILHVFFNAILI